MDERPETSSPDAGTKGTGTEDTAQVERRTLITWFWRVPVVLALAGGAWGSWLAYRVHFSKVRPDAPTFRPVPAQRIAALAELEAPWSSVAFEVANTPALLLRVPEAVPGGLSLTGTHYLAFSRVCTHLGCLVSLNRDLEALALAFNYRTDQPALACACHLSAFSPLQAGLAVSGPARDPLPRVQLERRGDALFAVGLEPPPS